MMIADILKTNLERIDSDCEGAVTSELNELYEETRYDGSRFHVPSFQAAGALWVSLIAKKEREFVKEIGRVLQTTGTMIDTEGVRAVNNTLDLIFSDDRYMERMRLFSEGVARKAASYGLVFDANANRVDLADATYRAAAMNALRRARNNLRAELDLHSRSSTPEPVRWLFQWWRYFQSHPWMSLATILLVIGIPWLASKFSLVELMQWLHTRWGRSDGIGL